MKFGCFSVECIKGMVKDPKGVNVFMVENGDKKNYYCTAQDFCDMAGISKQFYFKDLRNAYGVLTVNHDELTEYLKKHNLRNPKSVYYGKFYYVEINNVASMKKSIGKIPVSFLEDIIAEKNVSPPIVYNDEVINDDNYDDDDDDEVVDDSTYKPTRQIKPPPKRLEIIPSPPTPISSKQFELKPQIDLKTNLEAMERRLSNLMKAQMTEMALNRLMNNPVIREAAIQKIGEQVNESLRKELTPLVREKIRGEIASNVRAELTEQFTPLVKQQLKRQLEPEVAQEVIAKSAAPIPDLGNEVSNYISKFNKHK